MPLDVLWIKEHLFQGLQVHLYLRFGKPVHWGRRHLHRYLNCPENVKYLTSPTKTCLENVNSIKSDSDHWPMTLPDVIYRSWGHMASFTMHKINSTKVNSKLKDILRQMFVPSSPSIIRVMERWSRVPKLKHSLRGSAQLCFDLSYSCYSFAQTRTEDDPCPKEAPVRNIGKGGMQMYYLFSIWF